MVKFLELPRERSTGDKLLEGLGLASQSIGDMIGEYQKSKQPSLDSLRIKQQERLALDSILNRYSKRIGEIDTELKGGYGSFEDRKGLEAQRKSLQSERDQLLGFESTEFKKEIKTLQPQESEKKSSIKKGRMKFDLSNPEHKSKRDDALKRAKGNRKQAEQILLKEFEL